MSGVETSQWAALKRQRGGTNGQEGWPTPLNRASWSTVLSGFLLPLLDLPRICHNRCSAMLCIGYVFIQDLKKVFMIFLVFPFMEHEKN